MSNYTGLRRPLPTNRSASAEALSAESRRELNRCLATGIVGIVPGNTVNRAAVDFEARRRAANDLRRAVARLTTSTNPAAWARDVKRLDWALAQVRDAATPTSRLNNR